MDEKSQQSPKIIKTLNSGQETSTRKVLDHVQLKQDLSVFVIMSPEQRGIYDVVIKPVFEEELGWRCWRVDECPGAGNIVRQMVESIAQATLVMADLTTLHPNMLYELGVAHALGVPVLTLFQRGDGGIPFHLQSFHCIEYEDTIPGVTRLRNALVEMVDTLKDWATEPSTPVQFYLSMTKFPTTEHNKAFVIMNLDHSSFYDSIIKPTFEQFGWHCHSLHEHTGVGNIARQIVKSIAEATLEFMHN